MFYHISGKHLSVLYVKSAQFAQQIGFKDVGTRNINYVNRPETIEILNVHLFYL